MLNKIRIENFQSHEKTEIDLCSGVNIVHGLSQSGKTAIFRALNWVFFNRPSGFRFHSSFAKSPHTRVILFFDDCKVSLEKTEKTSKYILEKDGEVKTFSTIGTNVPEEITAALNISDLNISNQLDSPFFIVSSPGEIGRIFNAITNSEKADEFVSVLSSLINQKKSYISTLEKQADELQKKIDKITKLEKHEKKFQRYQILVEKEAALHDSIVKAKSLYERIKQKQDFVLSIDIKRIESLFDKLVSIDKKIESLSLKASKAKRLYDRADQSSSILSSMSERLEKLEKQVSNYQSIFDQLSPIYAKIEERDKLIQKFKKLYKLHLSIKAKEKEVKELQDKYQSELGEVCPYCFAKIDKERIRRNL